MLIGWSYGKLTTARDLRPRTGAYVARVIPGCMCYAAWDNWRCVVRGVTESSTHGPQTLFTVRTATATTQRVRPTSAAAEASRAATRTVSFLGHNSPVVGDSWWNMHPNDVYLFSATLIL